MLLQADPTSLPVCSFRSDQYCLCRLLPPVIAPKKTFGCSSRMPVCQYGKADLLLVPS